MLHYSSLNLDNNTNKFILTLAQSRERIKILFWNDNKYIQNNNVKETKLLIQRFDSNTNKYISATLHLLGSNSIFMGRNTDNTIVFDPKQDLVSRQDMNISLSNNRFILKDNSTHGSKVNIPYFRSNFL